MTMSSRVTASMEGSFFTPEDALETNGSTVALTGFSPEFT
jgi:hypothetical protein